MARDGLQAAGATVLLDGKRADLEADGDSDGGGGGDEDDEDERPLHRRREGYTRDDEEYAAETADDRHDYESLMRYLQQKRAPNL